MRISDWSSDVCSSDLSTKWVEDTLDLTGVRGTPAPTGDDEVEKVERNVDVEVNGKRFAVKLFVPADQIAVAGPGGDRKSVVSGKSVSGRVDLGGRRVIKKKRRLLTRSNTTAKH